LQNPWFWLAWLLESVVVAFLVVQGARMAAHTNVGVWEEVVWLAWQPKTRDGVWD